MASSAGLSKDGVERDHGREILRDEGATNSALSFGT
jgi:hypothetical protein